MKKSIIFLVMMLAVAGCGRRNIDAPPPTSAVFQPTPTQFVFTGNSSIDQPALIAEGEVVFNNFYDGVGFACETCHFAEQETRKIGPGLLNIGLRGEERVDGQSAEDYIRSSILHPNDYVVDDYVEGLMPQTYADLLTTNEVDALVAYLMSLQ